MIVGSLPGVFRIERFLGEGAFGQVYQVSGNMDGKQYAIKVATQEGNDEPRCLADLNHQHIVRYFGSWPHGDKVSIQMELCQGLPTAPMNIESTMKLLREMLLALQHMHSREWCHLDIKPPST